MKGSTSLRRWIWRGSLGLAAVLATALALLLLAWAVVDGNQLRHPLAHALAEHTGRDIHLDGPLQIHLLTLHPSVIAEQVTVGNPPWISPGTMARIGKLTVRFDWPWRKRPFAVRDLRLEGLDLRLKRDIDGHANWYWKAPGTLPGKGAPLVYALSVPDAHVTVDDDRRHLVYDGTLTVTAADAPRLSIVARGHLNGRNVILRIDGDPLATVSREKPYQFDLEERSGDSGITGHGSLLRPFDFRLLEGTFAARGPDLKDLYFLVGALLPNTGPYRLSGKVARHYTQFSLTDLLATTGESDMRVTLVSELFASGQSHVNIDLASQRLRLSDLGPRAAGRAAGPSEAKPLVLPETELRIAGVRRTNSDVTFHARELDAGPLTFHSVAGKMSIVYGEVKVPALSAMLPDGKISAHGVFDARPTIPTASLDLAVSRLRIGQLFRKDPTQPPLDGLLDGHVALSGRGRSVHELAASANGTMVVALPQGVMRASLAELAGANLRGLELLLSRSRKETPIRCAVASLRAHDGTLVARQLTIDTDRMLISGGGSIQLGTEALDLRIEGEPKGVRLLRLSGPLSIHGTLRRPALEIAKPERKVELLDPGHGKDVDCATLTAEAGAGRPPVGAGGATPSEREQPLR